MIRDATAAMRSQLARTGQAWFVRASATRPALRGHTGFDALLAYLLDSRRETFEARESLICDLIECFHESSDSVPELALFVAYEPLLSRIRRRIVSKRTPADELDQIVLTSFHSVLRRTSTRRRSMISLFLRQRTERLVFRALRRDAIPEVCLEVEQVAEHVPLEELALIAYRANADPDTRRRVEIVLETEREPRSADDTVTSYQRRKKQRTRAIDALQEQESGHTGSQLSLFPMSWVVST